ncbi:MAG TPA: serine/threonine-protein kinase, partial [Chroococcales cyanobacterium]
PLSHVILTAQPVFSCFWFLSNALCMSYFSSRLRGDLKIGRHLQARLTDAGKDIVIRYRAFAAVERWIQQRFAPRGEESRLKTMLTWTVLPVVIVGSLWAAGSLIPAINLSGGAAGAATGQLNLSFIAAFVSSIAAMFGASIVVFNRQPTHVGISSDGLRLLWRHKLFKKNGAYTNWEQINSVEMVRPAGKTSPSDDRLVFSTAAGPAMKLKMGSIDSVEDKELILKAIQKYGAHAHRDPAVIQGLQPPADYSYTELWLQALSAPPKRERLQPLMTGAFLHDQAYEVLHSLGVGGQGQAYLARDRRTGDSVVLKEFILPVYVDVNVRRTALEQFENEARILRHLDNPQIVKLLDFFVEDHRTYLVLEHIEGASLREIVKLKGKLDETAVRQLAIQMCHILEYLHALSPPVVHRDFTPDNLILKVDGTLKLIDFNVARQVVQATTSGTVVGKHAYLPPEQFRGMPETRSDIYAMGATLHYLLTGADPEPIAISHPQRLCPSVSDSINTIVERATALALEKRYADVQQIEADLAKPDP